jgi:acetylornithine deacetylase/succinyl-diaminopimelate desuccinylase-like protein
MNDDLSAAVDSLFPSLRSDLEGMVRIPSVSAGGFPVDEVRRSAHAVAELMEDAGLGDVQILEIDGAHPAVFGQIPGPEGAPTILLYAHHDVQPPGPDSDWSTSPFEPVEVDGRLHGRGAADDKAGIAVHLGAIRAHAGKPPVGIKVFVEGEEEIGSLNLERFIETYHDLLAADVIVIADSGNWRAGLPTLTTSLRGLVDCVVEVRTLGHAVHSGLFGGLIPDALTAMARLLATLHDDAGSVAVDGLVSDASAGLDLTEDEVREQSGVLAGTSLIGDGPLTSRMWTQPSISILGIDAPPTEGAISQLVPVARAKVSMRLAPGEDPGDAMKALTGHLEANAPWGAQVTVTEGATGDAIALSTEGPAYDAFRAAFAQAWGVDSVEMGIGGSIPFVSAFQDAYPGAPVLLTGVIDPTSRAHGPDESVDLDDLRRATLAEAIVFRLLAEGALG